MGMLLSALGSGAGYLADRLAEDHRLKEQDEIQKRRDQVIRQNALADRAEALAIKEADWEKQKAWETEKGNTNYAQTIARDQMNDKAAIDKEKELLPIKAQYEQQAYDRNHAGDKEYKEQYQQERLDMLRMQQEKLKQDQMDKIDAKIAELPQSATAQRQELERQKASLGKFQTSSYTGTPSKDSTIANVNKYDPLVKSLADKYSITPNEAKAIMIVESGGKANAVSSAGAEGPMQIMPGTKDYIAQKHKIDRGSMDQENGNIEAGIAYYKEMLDRYKGDKQLAFAAYNSGPGTVDKKLDIAAQAGNPRTYDSIAELLPDETKKYVPNVMANKDRLDKMGGSDTEDSQEPAKPQAKSFFTEANGTERKAFKEAMAKIDESDKTDTANVKTINAETIAQGKRTIAPVEVRPATTDERTVLADRLVNSGATPAEALAKVSSYKLYMDQKTGVFYHNDKPILIAGDDLISKLDSSSSKPMSVPSEPTSAGPQPRKKSDLELSLESAVKGPPPKEVIRQANKSRMFSTKEGYM